MEKLDIIIALISGAFTIVFGLLLIVWSSLNKNIHNAEVRVTNRIDSVEKSLSKRIDKLDEKLTDVDRRLCRMEGAFTSKDCCMLKVDHSHKVETA